MFVIHEEHVCIVDYLNYLLTHIAGAYNFHDLQNTYTERRYPRFKDGANTSGRVQYSGFFLSKKSRYIHSDKS